ncbi:hypothetical protein NFI96_017760 [Prochilodus magdalenae]|nr:hypothetical protein NFI96_017760 [Prochilodus magdalenae]
MFVVVEMVDTVRIPPWNFHRQLNDAIAEELNKKLANKASSASLPEFLTIWCRDPDGMLKPTCLLTPDSSRRPGVIPAFVVYNVGLCICLYDITKLEDSYIFPGDGASHTKVHFRYVVFHPFLDEILVGKIKYCSQEGVYVTLGFFDDILIPPESLQQPAKLYPACVALVCVVLTVLTSVLSLWDDECLFWSLTGCCSDEAEQVWVWEYETDEGAHDLYMDQGEEIRFRVVDELFLDTSPTGPSTDPEPPANSSNPGTAPAAATDDSTQKKEAPYMLMPSAQWEGRLGFRAAPGLFRRCISIQGFHSISSFLNRNRQREVCVSRLEYNRVSCSAASVAAASLQNLLEEQQQQQQ